MKKENPLQVYEKIASEVGITLEDLLYKSQLMSIKQFPNEETLGRIALSFCEMPQIYNYSRENNKKILVASTKLILNKRKISKEIGFLPLKNVIEEEYLFGITAKPSIEQEGFGYGNIVVRKGLIFSSEPHFKGCREHLFKAGNDYKNAMRNILQVYASNNEV